MEVDPARVRLVACWLRKAHNDLRAARWGLVADPPLVEDVAFHAQQAVEKAEKGLLVWHGVVFRKTHDLDELADQVLPLDPSLSSIVDRAADLTDYVATLRYPERDVTITVEEAQEASALAHETVKEILARLPAEVLP